MTSRILDLIRPILKSGDKLLPHAFPNEDDFQDVISAYRLGDDQLETTAKYDNLLDLVMTRLGHVSVNPSNRDISSFINQSYVHPDSDLSPEREGVFVNGSEDDISEFVNELIHAAETERKKSITSDEIDAGVDKQYPNREVFMITGDRGVGKSFFLNHVVSKHIDHLDENNVVWIRINLVADHGFDDDIQGWIQAQIAKILLRYYDESSEIAKEKKHLRHDYMDYLFSWIQNHEDLDENQKSTNFDKLMRLKAAFCKRDSDRSIGPVLCPSWICQELYRYARAELGISFVVVFDGFDRLDRDTMHRERFIKLQSEISRLVSGNTSHGAALMIVTRQSTIDTLAGVHPFNSITWLKYRVSSPTYDDILLRRLETLEEWLDKGRLHGFSRMEQHNSIDVVKDFRSKVLQNMVDSDYADSMAVLGLNNRAKSQIVQLWFQEHCDEEKQGGYRLIEHMVKANFVYPPIVYIYEEIEGVIRAVGMPEYIYDSRFLPLLARPSIPVGDRRLGIFEAQYCAQESMLLGVRLLQLLALWRTAKKKGRTNENLTIAEVCKALECLFGYDERIVRNTIYELECFETIVVERFNAYKTDSNDDRVRVLPKADHLLNRFLGDIAYLNFCGMRLIVAKSFHARTEFLRAATLSGVRDTDSTHKTRIKRWIVAKLHNALTTAALMMAVNEAQAQSFQLGLVALCDERITEKLTERELKSMFRLFDAWPEKIAKDVESISGSTNAAILTELEVISVLARLQQSINSLTR